MPQREARRGAVLVTKKQRAPRADANIPRWREDSEGRRTQLELGREPGAERGAEAEKQLGFARWLGFGRRRGADSGRRGWRWLGSWLGLSGTRFDQQGRDGKQRWQERAAITARALEQACAFDLGSVNELQLDPALFG